MSGSYPREEMDLKFDAVYTKIQTNHDEVMRELLEHKKRDSEMLEQVKYTNGKLKKIIIALVAVGAFSVGVGLQQVQFLISLFI